MSFYLDTSVLVSAYVKEQHSIKILQLIEESQESLCVSCLAEAEFYSAIAIKKRTKKFILLMVFFSQQFTIFQNLKLI